jgi:4-amino-4-deoxy-L-arabinose transferase-like glycosyltransferase
MSTRMVAALGALVALTSFVALAAAGAPLLVLSAGLAAVVVAAVRVARPEGATRITLAPLPSLALVACAIVFASAARAAARGALGNLAASTLLVASFVAALAAAHAASGGRGSVLRRPGFWVLATQALLGLPSLGSIGLFDPWEAHYGEVAREMLARHDAVSTFWGHEGRFTSKPVLLFWLQALALRACGIHAEPGHVLDGASGAVAHPEWALRLPIFFVATLGVYALFCALRRPLGAGRAMAGAIALASTPFFVFLSRQSITDVPLVGFLSAAMACLLAATSAGEGLVAAYELSLGPLRLRIHAGHVVAALVVLVLVPQAAWLVATNVELGARGLRWTADVVREGSAGNCTLPGQVPCAEHAPRFAFAPALQGALWLVIAGALFAVVARERRRRAVLGLAGWTFAALAVMAKGPLGLALPLGTVTLSALAARRPRLLLDIAPLRGLVIAAALVLPWYLATWVRHGRLFVDELVLRHMLGRTLDHLHDTNEGDDVSTRYYLVQLAFGLGPWIGPAVLGLGAALARRTLPAERFLLLWAVLGFALVTVMRTKFHHYVFPIVPPIAALAGATLARPRAPGERPPIGLVVAAMAAALLVFRALLGAGDAEGPARWVHLFTYQYARGWPASVDVEGPVAAIGALALLLPVAAWWRRGSIAALALAVVSAAFLGNVYLARTAPHWGQRAVFDAWAPHRGESSAPLIAYRLNWKGENFYTGNRLAIFGATLHGGGSLPAFVAEWRAKGARTLYAVTERGNVESLRAESGVHVEALTTEAESRQFCLVRLSL